jgi:hypothetical protein
MLSRTPHNSRPALHAALLSQQLRGAIEEIDGATASLRLVSEALYGLPRVVDVGGVAAISRDLAKALFAIDDQQRKLRALLLELKDFVR